MNKNIISALTTIISITGSVASFVALEGNAQIILGFTTAIMASFSLGWFWRNKSCNSVLEKTDPDFNAQIILFDLSTQSGLSSFTEEIRKSISSANDVIYRSGRGYSNLSSESPQANILLKAEDEALSKRVEIHRIQTHSDICLDWAKNYSQLMKNHSGKLKVYRDFKNPSLINVAVIDPDRSSAEVQLLFESFQKRARKSHFRSASGVIIRRCPSLAKTLGRVVN